MQSTHLNEHCANQGAQSDGEFLGMTGNSAWYLLGSVGVSVLMITFLWGMFGVSLLLCLAIGLVLCGFSVAYVFALKNNKPKHYDSDFFESALVEAGVLEFRFAPRETKLENPIADRGEVGLRLESSAVSASSSGVDKRGSGGNKKLHVISAVEPSRDEAKASPVSIIEDLQSEFGDIEQLNETLIATEEMLEEANAERGDN